MTSKKRIVLKLTGELLPQTESGVDLSQLEALVMQIKELSQTIQFGIVMGGGNFFRGHQHSKGYIAETVGHSVGMLATMMNGLIIQDMCEKKGMTTALFSALQCEQVAQVISPENVSTALATKDCLIFSGGTGNPYFSTDTTAIVRALQIEATEIWKGTKVDGIYNRDPLVDLSATLLKSATYKEALRENLAVMDMAAFALADQHKRNIRIFNIFTQNALLRAAQDPAFGSTLTA